MTVTVDGEAGGDWTAAREDGRWALYTGAAPAPAARVTVAADDAWRLLTRPQPPERIRALVRFTGDEALALAAFATPAVMA